MTMCNRSLKQTAISLNSCEAEFHAASACAGELLCLAELFKELHHNVSVRLEFDSDSVRRKFDAWLYDHESERSLCQLDA